VGKRPRRRVISFVGGKDPFRGRTKENPQSELARKGKPDNFIREKTGTSADEDSRLDFSQIRA